MPPGITFLALGSLAGVAGFVWFHRTRSLAERRRRDRNIVYTNLAHRQSLTHLEDQTPSHVLDRAETFGRATAVGHVLLGKDREGTFYVARTGAVGEDEPLLLFDNKAAGRLDGLHVEIPGRRDLRPFWVRALDRGTPAKARTRAHLRWSYRRAAELDDTTMALAGRVVRLCEEQSAAHAGLHLGVSVHQGQVCIHTNGTLQLSMAGEFIDRARQLRVEMLDALHDVGTTRWRASDPQSVDQEAIDKVLGVLSPPKGKAERSPHSGPLGGLDEILGTEAPATR